MSTSRYVIPDLDDDDEQQNEKESRTYFPKRAKIDAPPPSTNPPDVTNVTSVTSVTNVTNSMNEIDVSSRPVSNSSSSSLLVHSRQRGNPLLKYIRQVKWEYTDTIPGGVDYQMNRTSCALYLSLRYHTLNPNYIYERLKTTKIPHQLKILLVQCDLAESSQSLKELARLCLIYDLTLLLCWTDEESAKYLETYKILEGKSAENLLDGQQIQSNDFLTKYLDTITQVKSINKSDGQTLLHAFGSFQSIVNATNEQLAVCPGLGKLKAQRLFQTFHQPFRRTKTNKIEKISSQKQRKIPEDFQEDVHDLSNIDEDI